MSTEQAADTSQAGKDPGVPQRLKDFVQRFRICWEALPDHYYVKKEKRQIGFTLELTGTHESGVEHPQPGCPHCQHVCHALQEIAGWILPKEIRDSDYEISVYNQGIQYTAVRKFRPDVSLRISIRHRSGFDREVDACEVRCLNEMTERLAQIGARKAQWGPDDGEDQGELYRKCILRRYGS
jgi:hypothetical protein